MRILFVQHTIGPPGGGNAVAAWMLQALAGRHRISALTERAWQPEDVDRYYGTSLAGAAIEQMRPGGAGPIVRRLPGRLDRLRMAVLLGEARRHAGRFDLAITADNYGAFGRRGLQYLHYPAQLRPDPERWPMLVHAYYAACDRLSGLTWEAARLNDTLVNSEWTAARLLQETGIRARVLYPPVADPGPGLPWPERTNTFLCVSRLDRLKRIDLAAAILSRVRGEVPDVRLHIVGSPVDDRYAGQLYEMARREASWITISEDLSQREVFELMGRCRYGIHAMDREHFGIAVAEMARAGCLVFVHDSGGQVEAIGGARPLRWSTEEDAVARIRAVLAQPVLQEDLSATLRAHAARFSTERFINEFRLIVDGLA